MKIHYPKELPISSHTEKLIQSIKNSTVTLIVGETGSGKSTQIPKMILAALGKNAKIACTQPRRIAAVSIAARIASECEIESGTEVGHRIRFDNHTNSQTRIVVCTDGILLQEIKFDGLLTAYDAILVDEAHERSLRIDFLLGLLKDIQRKRSQKNMKPLKIIIASATLESDKFASFFEDTLNIKSGKNLKKTSKETAEQPRKAVPVFEISGRTYPVKVVHTPLSSTENIYEAIAEKISDIHTSKQQGDILVFLPGEQEIHMAKQIIETHRLSNLECFPLFSKLTMEEQLSIFNPHPGKRHVIVATNIAETSLTVPGITTVIDSGLAKITDFDPSASIGSLTVQKISQASAIQRTGRAGRIEPGICYRLYSKKDFLAREPYTKPEIKRSSLAEVVLQMILMDISNIHTFDFIDPPDHAAFEEAFETLKTLGAIDHKGRLTKAGYKMAHLPLDPKISRMLLTAEEHNCVPNVALIASFLSVKDCFVRPSGSEEEAEKSRQYFQRLGMLEGQQFRPLPFRKRGKFRYKKVRFQYQQSQSFFSDLLTSMAVWKKVFSLQNETERQLFCNSNYINFEVLTEVRAIFQQLIETLAEFGGEDWKEHLEKAKLLLEPHFLNTCLNRRELENILKSVASGLIQNICVRNKFGSYSSPKVGFITIHPGSLFFHRRPKMFIAAELIETTKLFARNVTEIDPNWLPEIAPWFRIKKSLSTHKAFR